VRGVQLPTRAPEPISPAPEPVDEGHNPALEGEGTSDWMMVADFINKYALAAEISETEALEPQSVEEAKRRPDWPLWEKAIDEELAVLKAAGTWELVDAPAGANIVGSKWIFRAKKDAADNVVRYRARLVAQGFSQVLGVDYFDMFALVARLASIRAVLAVAAVENFEIHQINIKGCISEWGTHLRRNHIYETAAPLRDSGVTGQSLPTSQNPVRFETVREAMVPAVGLNHGQRVGICAMRGGPGRFLPPLWKVFD